MSRVQTLMIIDRTRQLRLVVPYIRTSSTSPTSARCMTRGTKRAPWPHEQRRRKLQKSFVMRSLLWQRAGCVMLTSMHTKQSIWWRAATKSPQTAPLSFFPIELDPFCSICSMWRMVIHLFGSLFFLRSCSKCNVRPES